MKKLAVIGASYLQLPLIEKAKELHIETHVFAWKANDVGEKAADFFYPVSIVEKEEILKKCMEIQIDGICSIASDLGIITVNYVAEAMGLWGNSMESTYRCTNKHMMRLALSQGGDPSPKSILVDRHTDLFKLRLSYPIIVKPTDRSGSRGICKLSDGSNLKQAVDHALEESFEKKAVIEEYVEGKEYSVEYISFCGNHHYLAVTEKFTTGEPHFIETGHMEPARLNEGMIDKIKKIVEHALDSLHITSGASHTEIKIDKLGRITIIEIGARMGGDCIGSDLVRYSTGIDFVRAVIQVALGQPPDLTVTGSPETVKSVFILSHEDLQELERLKSEEPQRLIRIAFLAPELADQATSSANRAGCYILRM